MAQRLGVYFSPLGWSVRLHHTWDGLSLCCLHCQSEMLAPSVMDQLVAVFSSRLLALKGAETIFEASLQFALLWRIYISSDIGTSDCSTIPKHSTPENNLNKGPPAPEPVIEPENTKSNNPRIRWRRWFCEEGHKRFWPCVQRWQQPDGCRRPGDEKYDNWQIHQIWKLKIACDTIKHKTLKPFHMKWDDQVLPKC